MVINDVITLLAGGPGSGCHGPNCGRPKGHEGAHGPETREEKTRRYFLLMIKTVLPKYGFQEKRTVIPKYGSRSSSSNEEKRYQYHSLKTGSKILFDESGKFTFTQVNNDDLSKVTHRGTTFEQMYEFVKKG